MILASVSSGNPAFTGSNGIVANPCLSTKEFPLSSINGSRFGLPGIGPGEPLNVQLALKIKF